MCVRAILDASAFRHFSACTKDSAGDQFRKWLDRGDGLLVYSTYGKYGAELGANNEILESLRSYVDRGRAIDIGSAKVEMALNQIFNTSNRRSDDPHILALALAGDATVLFSCDKKLCQDFANPRVISKVGRQERHSVPDLHENSPEETTKARNRKRFLNSRICTSC